MTENPSCTRPARPDNGRATGAKMPGLRELRVIVAVAEAGGFTRAAARLGISQPAVSQQVLRIEHRLGRTLFRRTTQSLALTPDGAVLLDQARAMLDIAARAKAHFAGACGGRILRLGLTGELALDGADALLARIYSREPQVRIAVSTASSRALLAAIDAGALDVVVASRPPDRRRGHVLWTQHLTWVGLVSVLSASRHNPIPLALYSGNTVSHGVATGALAAAGRSWTVAFESASTAGLRAAVKAGFGLSAFPEETLPGDIPRIGVEHGLPQLGTIDTIVEGARDRGPALAGLTDTVRDAALDALNAMRTGAVRVSGG